MLNPSVDVMHPSNSKIFTHGNSVIRRSFIKELAAILLGGDRGRQMNGDHLQEGVSSGQPAAHHRLQEGFTLLVLIVGIQLDVKLLDHFCSFLLLEIHDGIENLKGSLRLVTKSNKDARKSKKTPTVPGSVKFIITCQSGQSEECLTHHLQAQQYEIKPKTILDGCNKT